MIRCIYLLKKMQKNSNCNSKHFRHSTGSTNKSTKQTLSSDYLCVIFEDLVFTIGAICQQTKADRDRF